MRPERVPTITAVLIVGFCHARYPGGNRNQSGLDTPLPSPCPKRNACHSTSPNPPFISPAFFRIGSIIPAGYSYLRSEGRNVGVCPSRFEDAPGQGKEVMVLSILNLPVILNRFFHKVINKTVEK
jgi:hypothetical protein